MADDRADELVGLREGHRGKDIGGKRIGRKIFGWESEGDEQMRKCLEDDNPGIRTLEASTG
jgi:hypothetical protein